MAIVMDTFHAEDSTTNTVVTISEFIKKSSGTPASGIGAAIALGAEDSAGNAEQAIQIQGYLSTVTSGAEVGAFLLRIVSSGSLATALTITPTAATFVSPITSASDTDSTHTFGRGRISSPASDSVYFSHIDYATAGGAALRQNSFGTVELNAAQTRTIVFKINDTNITQMTATLWTYADAVDIAFNTTTGTKIGTGTTQKIGFWNATPIVQPASANQAALSLDVDVTGGDTVDKTAINTNFTNIQTLVNQLRSDLVAAGLIKGAA